MSRVQLIALALALVLALAVAARAAAPDNYYVVYNAVVRTSDAARATASAFAVQNGRFVAVGSDDDVRAQHSAASVRSRGKRTRDARKDEGGRGRGEREGEGERDGRGIPGAIRRWNPRRDERDRGVEGRGDGEGGYRGGYLRRGSLSSEGAQWAVYNGRGRLLCRAACFLCRRAQLLWTCSSPMPPCSTPMDVLVSHAAVLASHAAVLVSYCLPCRHARLPCRRARLPCRRARLLSSPTPLCSSPIVSHADVLVSHADVLVSYRLLCRHALRFSTALSYIPGWTRRLVLTLARSLRPGLGQQYDAGGAVVVPGLIDAHAVREGAPRTHAVSETYRRPVPVGAWARTAALDGPGHAHGPGP